MATKIAPKTFSRRGFILTTAAVSGGMVLGFHIPVKAATTSAKARNESDGGTEVNAWLAIDKDNTVTIRIPHTEQGQGGMTSVALLVAEELNVEWSKVKAEFADFNRHLRNNKEYIETSTHGSQLVRLRHPHLMQAGASARERLKQAAAEAWGVDRSQVEAKQGMLRAGNHTATYGEFAEAAAKVKLDKEPAINLDPSTWWLLGKANIQRIDIPHKVNGNAQYAIDTRLPGMVYAAVKASPVPWGKLKSYNFDAIKNRPGIIAAVPFKAVEGKRNQPDLQDAVAVVADSWYRAKTALELMPIEWDFGDSAKQSTASLYEEGHQRLAQKGLMTNEEPKALEVIAASQKVVTADYERPFETHARMEPINATVWVQDDRVDVWSPCQDQSVPIILVADQTGRSPKDVYAHTPFLGGAFGGGGGGGTAVTRQAAEISKQLKKPVKVVWSREEDLTQDKQRPLALARLTAALGSDGLPEAIHTRAVWAPLDGVDKFGGFLAGDYGVSNMPYKIPLRQHERFSMKTHVPSSTHRAPGANQMGFMTESFIDEIAIAGGWDPLEWRLKMTEGMDDYQLVLKTLKDKSGFRTDLPKGEGMGVAVVESHGTIAACCATVTVSRRGRLNIEKLVMVMDPGHIINPNGGAEQAEGSCCWELSHAWMGGHDLDAGRFVTTNFDTYNLLRIDQMPDVEVHWALSGGKKWGGLGEPAGPPTPPAVANAIWYATGKRIRSTPFRMHDLSWA